MGVGGALIMPSTLSILTAILPGELRLVDEELSLPPECATPIAALLTTTLAVQLVLVLVLFVDDALDFMLNANNKKDKYGKPRCTRHTTR